MEESTNQESNAGRKLLKIKKYPIFEKDKFTKYEEKFVDQGDYRAMEEIFRINNRSWNLEQYENSDWFPFDISDTRAKRLYIIPELGRPIPEPLLGMDALEELGLMCCDVAISKWPPKSFGKLTSIKNLYIWLLKKDDCIPEEISELSNLESLFLVLHSEARLLLPFISLPKSMGNLMKLRLICFHGFQEFPRDVLHFQNIECLVMFNSNMLSLPSEIGNLKNLKGLHLGQCENLIALPDEIGDLINLEYIDIRHCENISTLPVTMKNLKKLRKLDLPKEVLNRASILPMLSTLAHDLPYLGFVGLQSGIKNDPKKLDLALTLMHNRARTRLESSGKGTSVQLGLWPLILAKSECLFSQYSSLDKCKEESEIICKPDSIFQILVTYCVELFQDDCLSSTVSRKRKHETV